MTVEKITEAVRKKAVEYWRRDNEPVELLRVWIADRAANGDIEVRVAWVSASTINRERDDMIYTVAVAGEYMTVHGPEW